MSLDDDWNGEGYSPPQVIPEEMSQDSVTDAWLAFIRRYENDRVSFAEDVLGTRLMRHQRDILRAADQKKRRIALRSGHRVGKTHLLAILAIHHLVCKYPQKTIITAPTAGQLFDSLFAEIMMLVKKLPEFVRELLQTYTDQITLKADPDGSFLSARTADPTNAESFQGIHSENVLFIWDEASGIDERLFKAARGSMAAPNALRVLAGNPVRLNNTFHRAFTANADLYEKFRISSLGLPTVDQDFVNEIVNEFGSDSNEYRVRILGEFPDTDDESYISNRVVRAARNRQISPPPMSPVVYGVDPARQGDDRTVITRRRGLHYIEPQLEFRRKNTMQIVGEIQQMAIEDQNRLVNEYKQANRPLNYLPPVPAAIVVDVIGIGAGVVDRLMELGFNVISVNAAENSTDEPLCARVRDALWKKGRDFFENAKSRIPDDEALQNEITAAHYDYNSTGVLTIESKKSMKKRGLRSPDKADSLFLALMAPAELFATVDAASGSYGYGRGPKTLSFGAGRPTAR